MVERFAPVAEGLKQGRQLDMPKAPRRLGEIRDGAFQHRSHAHPVSRGIVVEGYRDLYHTLKKLLVFGRCRAPDVFEGFVGVEELGVIEQADSPQILIGIHSSFLHSPMGSGGRTRSKLRLYGFVRFTESQKSKIETPTGRTLRNENWWP